MELIDIVAKVPGWAIHKATVIGYSGEPETDAGLTPIDAYPDDPAPATLAVRDALKAARIPFTTAAATKPLDLKGKSWHEIRHLTGEEILTIPCGVAAKGAPAGLRPA